MAKVRAVPGLWLIPAVLLAGCGSGEDRGREVDGLKAKSQAQAGEIEALRKSVTDLDAKTRALEEQVAAARADAQSPAPAAATKGPGADGDAARDGTAPAGDGTAPDPASEAVAAYLDTDRGRVKFRELLRAEQKRQQEEQEQQRRTLMLTAVRERITGPLTEQLGLDSNQQQALIGIATDAMEKMGEIWRSTRDGGGDGAGFAAAGEKSREVFQQSMTLVQQALTVDQYNRLQEMRGAGNLFGFGGRGMGGAGFGPPQGGDGSPGPAGQGRGGR